MKKTLLICCATMMLLSLGCEDALDPDQDTIDTQTQEQPIINGSLILHQSGINAAIGRVVTSIPTGTSLCSGTLLNPKTVLTAAHCLNVSYPNTKRTTFIGGDGNAINGTAFVHPKWTDSLSKHNPFDFAIIKLDSPINLNNFGSVIFPKLSTRNIDVGDSVIIAGFGPIGGSCNVNTIGALADDIVTITGFHEDADYVRSSSNSGTCKGDSGGPALLDDGGDYYIVGVASTFATSWNGTRLGSRWKPVYTASHWIKERLNNWAQPQALDPAMTGKHCIGYNNTIHSTHVGISGGQILNPVPSNLNNQFTRLWVSKGYRLKGYDQYNLMGGKLIDVDGFNGEDCNEKGCWYNLYQTPANNRISSMRCSEDLPQDTWGYCVLYDNYNNGNYFSTRNNNTSLGVWSNRAKHVWVKKNRTLKLYPRTSYGTDNYYHINSITLTGNTPITGSICNAFGCLHDLANKAVSREGIASSLKCY